MKGGDPGSGLGSNPNPGGGGGGASWEWDEVQFDSSNAEKEKNPEVWSQYQQYYQDQDPAPKKKREAEQCELNEKFESNAVKKLVKKALGNQRVKQEYEGIKRRLKEGVNPLDIGKKSTKISNNKVLIKGAHGRYVVEISGNQVNVLGIGDRGNATNMSNFRDLMNEKYGLNLQYNKK